MSYWWVSVPADEGLGPRDWLLSGAHVKSGQGFTFRRDFCTFRGSITQILLFLERSSQSGHSVVLGFGCNRAEGATKPWTTGKLFRWKPITEPLRGGTNAGMVIGNVFQRWCKNHNRAIMWLENCNYAFSVHSEHTLRRHSRGPSIHFRPSLSLIYNAGRIHELTTQPPNTSAIRDDGRCPCFQPQHGNVENTISDWNCSEMFGIRSRVWTRASSLADKSRPAAEIQMCRKHNWIKYELSFCLYLVEHIECKTRHFFSPFSGPFWTVVFVSLLIVVLSEQSHVCSFTLWEDSHWHNPLLPLDPQTLTCPHTHTQARANCVHGGLSGTNGVW